MGSEVTGQRLWGQGVVGLWGMGLRGQRLWGQGGCGFWGQRSEVRGYGVRGSQHFRVSAVRGAWPRYVGVASRWGYKVGAIAMWAWPRRCGGAWPRCVGVASGGTSKRGPLRWGRGLSVCGRGLEVRGVAPGWGYKTGPIAIGRGLRANGRGLEVEGVASRCGGAPMRGGAEGGAQQGAPKRRFVNWGPPNPPGRPRPFLP